LGQRMFGAAACSVALLDDEGEHLIFRAAQGDGAQEVIGLRLPVSLGIAGWAVSSGQPIAVDHVERDPRFARDVAESTGYVPRTILAAPVETSENMLGVIEVLDRTPLAHRDDLGLLSLLAHHLALGLELNRTLARDGSQSGSVGEVGSMLAELGRLGAAEQQAAADLLRVFIDHVRRTGGPARLV
ncbi:MAG: GAF domain-containing protein, partial [Mycobacteriales bacterium]